MPPSQPGPSELPRVFVPTLRLARFASPDCTREDGAMPYRIAVVCLGNICRSPMAAAVLRHKVAEAGLADEVVVSSAGTGDWHVGSGADRRARAALRARGYSDEHRAQQFSRRDFADQDLVLGMDSANVHDLRRIAPDAEIGAAVRLFDIDADVTDPYYGGPQDFEEALDQIERAADTLIAELPDLLRSHHRA